MALRYTAFRSWPLMNGEKSLFILLVCFSWYSGLRKLKATNQQFSRFVEESYYCFESVCYKNYLGTRFSLGTRMWFSILTVCLVNHMWQNRSTKWNATQFFLIDGVELPLSRPVFVILLYISMFLLNHLTYFHSIHHGSSSISFSSHCCGSQAVL